MKSIIKEQYQKLKNDGCNPTVIKLGDYILLMRTFACDTDCDESGYTTMIDSIFKDGQLVTDELEFAEVACRYTGESLAKYLAY